MKGISEYQRYGEGIRYIYIIGGEEFVSSFPLSFPDTVFVSIKVEDWNRYLSPYRAENPFRKGDYFSGDADTLLSSIINDLIPMVENKEKTSERYLLGYSMGGLFSLYAASLSNAWKGVGSVSGSLWYINYDEYVSSYRLLTEKIYLSLGRKEKESRNKVLKTVEEKTNIIYETIKSEGIECTFRLQEGGHFQDEEKRIRDAVSYLLGLI